MEDIMALVIIFILLGFGGSILGIVSTVLKKIVRAVTGDPKAAPQRRVEPMYRQVRSSGGEQQLAQIMKQAVQNAAGRGEGWARAIVDNAAQPAWPPQGGHTPLAPSGEGFYGTEGLHMHDEEQADSCRAVSPVAEPLAEEDRMTVRRAVKRAGSVTGQRAARKTLAITPQNLQQGIIWSEILNRRGGRGNIH